MTMKKQSYKEQLKSPKWQKRRLEIMGRDNFTCLICGSTDKQLHVHHIKYEPGLNIWEYSDNHLITLCEDCHRKEHGTDFDSYSVDDTLYELRQSGYTNFEISLLLTQLIDENDSLLIQIANSCKESGLIDEYNSIIRLSKRRERIREDVAHINNKNISNNHVTNTNNQT